MTSQTLLIILGAVLSLLFSYIPGLATWYQPLDETKKRLIMLGLLAVITGAVFGLSCTPYFAWVECSEKGAMGLFTAFIFAAMANQATSSLSPKVGLRAPLSKDMIVTSSQGVTETVGVKETGVVSTSKPDDEAPVG
jgi:hypothetical protein